MTDIKLVGAAYNDLLILRGVISSVPLIGSYLDLYLSGEGQKFAQERIEYMVNELQIEMESVQENLLNSSLFNSEEGYDIVQKTFIAAARTRQKEKLKLFAKILRGAFTTTENKHDTELYLRIVDELSEKELEIASLFYSVKVEKIAILKESGIEYNGMAISDASLFSNTFPKFSEDEFTYTFARLEKTGIIKELVGSYTGYGGGSYNVTPLFTLFIDFIKK